MEFWNDVSTDRSWEVLIQMGKKFNFILIGGWACYLLTKTLKSKDIDIIVDFEVLEKLRQEFHVKKTDFLRKYETRIEGISIDIYIPHYSKFPLPAEAIGKNLTEIEGFRVPKPEILLILKQQAEIDRSHSIKGQKDRADILNILIRSHINLDNYKKLVKKHNLSNFKKRLQQIISESVKEFKYLGISDPGKIKRIKSRLTQELR